MAELRIRYPLLHSPFTFRAKDSGKDSRRALTPLENTRVNRTILRQTFTLANNVEKAFWDGAARAFSIFKESRVRIDYCKICRGEGGRETKFRDEKLSVHLETIKMMFFLGTIWGEKEE